MSGMVFIHSMSNKIRRRNVETAFRVRLFFNRRLCFRSNVFCECDLYANNGHVGFDSKIFSLPLGALQWPLWIDMCIRSDNILMFKTSTIKNMSVAQLKLFCGTQRTRPSRTKHVVLGSTGKSVFAAHIELVISRLVSSREIRSASRTGRHYMIVLLAVSVRGSTILCAG